MNAGKHVSVIKKLTSQRNGRFLVRFTDDKAFKTAPDSQVNFKIENSEYNDGAVVEVTIKHGYIVGIENVETGE